MKLTWPFLSLVLGACTAAPVDDLQHLESQGAELQSTSCWQQTLPWGTGQSEVGLVPRGLDQVARGPQALVVGNEGEVFVLDSVNGRVLGITEKATRIVLPEVATDAEDLAVATDGALALHSPLQARAWIFDPEGAPAGELNIPRSFRSLVGIGLGTSREIILRSAYQETYAVGSPAAPKDLATLLSQKREGAFQLSDGRGVALRVKAGAAELVLLRSSAGAEARTQVSGTHAITGEVTGGHLVGMSGDIACMRLEQVEQPSPDEAITVHRRALCINALSGVVAYESAMPAPSIYRPRHELAVGGETPVVASLQPSSSGLTVEVCEVLR